MTAVVEQGSEFEQLREHDVEALFALPITTTDGQQVSVLELAGRSLCSDVGRHMDTQPLRFAQNFGYEPREAMVQDIGYDVMPIAHQLISGVFVARILAREAEVGSRVSTDVSDADKAVVLLASSTHDMGEAVHDKIIQKTGAVVGDIPFGCKTAQDRQTEVKVRQAIDELYYADLSRAVLEQREAIIAHTDKTILNDINEAAHVTQSIESALNARQAFLRERVTNPGLVTVRHQQLARLANNVITSQISEAEKYAGQFTYVAEFLARNEEAIFEHAKLDGLVVPELRSPVVMSLRGITRAVGRRFYQSDSPLW